VTRRRRLQARAVAPLLAAAILGCTPTAALMTPPPRVKPPPARAGEVTGGITFSSGGVATAISYGPWHVKGPGLELAYAGDGEWVGTWNGADARFKAAQGLLRGPGTMVQIDERDGALALRGTWGDRGVEVTVSPRGLKARTEPGGCTLDLTATGIGTLSGPIGCPGVPGKPVSAATGTLLLQGEAVLVPHVLLPQVVMALLSALP
jgi:hypothetical protein